MKKSKTFALPLIAMVIAAFSISLMSFKTIKSTTQFSSSIEEEYWNFTGSGTPSVPDDRTNPHHYTLSSVSDECDGSEEICQVKAPADPTDPTGNTPDFEALVPSANESVLERIEDAMQNGANETATLKDN